MLNFPSTWSLALELIFRFSHIAGYSNANLNQFVLVTNPSMSMDINSPKQNYWHLMDNNAKKTPIIKWDYPANWEKREW